jgi:hypothetical protein
MSEVKKQFKYYAVRTTPNTVVFRRTVNKLQKIKSVIYKPDTRFRLEQISYIGGKAIGFMSYAQWRMLKGAFALKGCKQLTRDEFRALDPFMTKGE